MEKVNPSFSVNCKLASVFAVVELYLLNIMEAVFPTDYVCVGWGYRALHVSCFCVHSQVFFKKLSPFIRFSFSNIISNICR